MLVYISLMYLAKDFKKKLNENIGAAIGNSMLSTATGIGLTFKRGSG